MAARYQLADDPRENAREQNTVINPLRGISDESEKDFVTDGERSDSVEPAKRDIRPEDVFRPVPKHVSVRDYVRQGWPGSSSDYEDMDDALSDDVPKDKGYDTVKNLSQYLLETKGGGGTPSVEK